MGCRITDHAGHSQAYRIGSLRVDADHPDLAELAMAHRAGVVGESGVAGPDPWGAGRSANSFIDADHAGGELVSGLASDGFFSEDHGSQSIFGIVRKSDGLVGIAYGLDAQDWAEGLDGHDVHVVIAVVENGGGDEVAVHWFVAEEDFGALVDRVIDLGDDMVFLFTHDHRADFAAFFVAVADGEGFGFLDELGEELVFD